MGLVRGIRIVDLKVPAVVSKDGKHCSMECPGFEAGVCWRAFNTSDPKTGYDLRRVGKLFRRAPECLRVEIKEEG